MRYLLGIFLLVASAAAKEPVYECKNPQGESLRVLLQKNNSIIRRSFSTTREEREWVLTESAAFEDLPKEPIRYLYTLPEKGKGVDFKKLFEVREQFFRERKPQELQMMFLQEGEILKGWRCVTHGTQMDIKMLENFSDSVRADVLFLTRAVKGFVTEDQLTEDSVGMLLQVIERYALWSAKMDKTELRRLALTTFQPVIYLSPVMARQVNERLSENGKQTWELILKELSFDSFSPIQRWVFWVGLASRNNNEAFRAGIRGFVKSPAFQDGNMQKFFEKETKTVFKSLSPGRFKQILESGLSEKEQGFCKKLWSQRNG